MVTQAICCWLSAPLPDAEIAFCRRLPDGQQLKRNYLHPADAEAAKIGAGLFMKPVA